MSRFEFKSFIQTLEHSIILKDNIARCKTPKDVISVAKKYGFSISQEDFNHDEAATKIEAWFKESQINTLRYLT